MRFKPDICSADIKNFLKDVVLPLEHQEGAQHYNDVHSERYAITIKALAKVPLEPDAAILELAAEPYGMSAFLASEFSNLTLANYSETSEVRQAVFVIDGQSHRIPEHGFNVEKDIWPLAEESFDFVMACEIVEHLAMDPMALFAGANRVLRPGGYFLVSTPNAASIQNFIKLGRLMPPGLAQQFRRPFSMAKLYERHNREYTPFTIGEMMLAAGFEIFIMETDSAFPIFDLGFTPEQIETLISVIGVPEQRRDTINVIGRKIGPVVIRYPESHELYVAADA